MGSRFGDVKGYNEDASLNPEYLERMAKIIKACDERKMIVLVGCLYWGNSRGKWDSWKQQDAENAVANTIRWLSENNFKNVMVDPDNEGMAQREMGFDILRMIAAGKKVDPDIMIGFPVQVKLKWLIFLPILSSSLNFSKISDFNSNLFVIILHSSTLFHIWAYFSQAVS